jgi:hypothetical protein
MNSDNEYMESFKKKYQQKIAEAVWGEVKEEIAQKVFKLSGRSIMLLTYLLTPSNDYQQENGWDPNAIARRQDNEEMQRYHKQGFDIKESSTIIQPSLIQAKKQVVKSKRQNSSEEYISPIKVMCTESKETLPAPELTLRKPVATPGVMKTNVFQTGVFKVKGWLKKGHFRGGGTKGGKSRF